MSSTVERFENKFNKLGEDDCWIWFGRKHCQGYGYFRLSGYLTLAHRVAWTLYRGEIPDGLCVLHHCDNPPCVNPRHLFLGTQIDNVKDAQDKGKYQGRYGERACRVKLTQSDVDYIRFVLSISVEGSGVNKFLARQFGVQAAAISKIKTGRTWGNE